MNFTSQNFYRRVDEREKGGGRYDDQYDDYKESHCGDLQT